MTAATDFFRHSVASAAAPVPVTCSPRTPCIELVARMAAAGAPLAVVVDDGGRVLGTLTERDIVRSVAFAVPGDTPVAQVMAAPAVQVAAEDRLFRAVAALRRQGVDHAVVVDRDGRPVGILGLRDALAASSLALRQADALAGPATPEGLRAVKAAQAQVAQDLLDEAVPAPDVLRLLSDVNDDLYRQVMDAALAAMAEDGWGAPPVPFATIVMGSSGRGESLLRPDQDNAFVIADYPDADHGFVDGFFMELAARMTRRLDAVGIPFCNGNVMATNPLWRKTLPQWCRQIDAWGRRRHGVALLYADIFFDFRRVQGMEALTEDLRTHALGVVARHRAFLRDMSQNESHHSVGLGWFHRFVTDDEEGLHQGEINLKRNAILPVVEAVRLYALRAGLRATGTLDRIAALRAAGVFQADTADYLAAGFAHVLTLLLRRQLAEAREGRLPSGYIPPESLSSRDKDLLALTLKAVERLSYRVQDDFTGNIL